MSDYISREAVLMQLCNRHCATDPAECLFKITHNGDPGCFTADDILKIPAADVRPVKEGHWVKARGSWCTPGGDPVWECSECGKGVHVYGIEHGTYGSDIADGQWVSCPNCGAMMGGTP